MKKFISALSSFVIAATAMGGTMAVSTSAADATETIVALRSNNEKTVTAKAGDTIPVEVYIPQSSGFNSLLLKFAIGKDGNLDDTKGQGSVVDRNGTEIKNYKDAFGNYGITMTAKGDAIGGKATDFSYPNCLESGKATDFSLDAGDIVDTGIAMFNTEAWSILYQAKPEINSGVNVDAFGAWVAAGGKLEEDFDYSNYTPVTKWSSDADWAYKYTFTKFDLKLPSNLPDGTYVFDVYKDVYINTHPGSLFDDDNNPLPDDKRGDAQSNFTGVDGKQKFSTEKLTIVVGDGSSNPPASTTEPSQNPTTTEPGGQTVSGDTIVYDLVPNGKDYTPASGAGKNNYVKVAAGDALQIDWKIKNDQGTAGLQMNFDFTQVEYVSGKRGSGYRVTPTYSDFQNSENLKKGECVYTWAQSDEAKASDNSVIYSFTVKVPTAAGTYSVGLSKKANDVNKVVPQDQTKEHKFTFYGLDIVVGAPVVTTTAPETPTTTAPENPTTTAPENPTTTQPPIGTTAEPQNPGTTAEPTPSVLYGDVNCDGDVRINDVVLLNKYLAKNATVSKQGLLNADCEKDDKVDAKDATKIKKFLALLIDRSELGKKSS